MNIYLDIDGVLLANDVNPANHADKFIAYVVTCYPTYWLTTHCRQKVNNTIPLLSRIFSEETMKYVRQIKPTEWDINKTEGIDFTLPFLWFDDDLFEEEKQALVRHNALDNWIEIDLMKDENVLEKFLASFPKPVNGIGN